MRSSWAGGARFQLAAAYLAILASVAVVSFLGPVWSRPACVLSALAIGGLSWWRASALCQRAGVGMATLVAGAVLLRAVAAAGAPQLSDDVYRYVWEAAVLEHGHNPYALAPDATELEQLRSELPSLYARLNHRDVPAAYPPVTQACALLVVRCARAFDPSAAPDDTWRAGVAGLRAFAALCDLLLLWPLAVLLRRLHRAPSLAVVWAWSPLVTLEFAGSGHLDSLGLALWIGALAVLTALPVGRPALPSAREAAGLVLLALAVLVKILPVCSLPFVVRGRGALARVALVLGLAALAYVPFASLRTGATGLFAGLSEYAFRWESTSLVYRFVEAPLLELFERDLGWTDPRRLGRAAIALAWLAAAFFLWRRRADPLRASWALTALFLVLSPTLHPWYLAWALPFVALQPSAAWCWLACVAPLGYAVLVGWHERGVWHEPAWYWPLAALPFFALLALERGRRARVAEAAR